VARVPPLAVAAIPVICALLGLIMKGVMGTSRVGFAFACAFTVLVQLYCAAMAIAAEDARPFLVYYFRLTIALLLLTCCFWACSQIDRAILRFVGLQAGGSGHTRRQRACPPLLFSVVPWRALPPCGTQPRTTALRSAPRARGCTLQEPCGQACCCPQQACLLRLHLG